MITHGVIFNFKTNIKAETIKEFLQAAHNLNQIPGVIDLAISRQTSPKNTFAYGITMQFQHTADYAFYSSHSQHQNFIEQYWLPHVADFLEIDLEKVAI
jgi:hypothetical protein